MRLIRILLTVSKPIFIISTLIGLLSGASRVGLIAVINSTLQAGLVRSSSTIWLFVGLTCLVMFTHIFSRILLATLGHQLMFDLRFKLTLDVMASPLRRLEEIGTPRLLAALHDDLVMIGNALIALPVICVNVVACIICFVYLGAISGAALLTTLGFLIVGLITYLALQNRALRAFERAHAERDAIFVHLRALTDGIKELKLHTNRRQAFLTQVLEPTAHRYRRELNIGQSIYAVAEGWAQLLMFVGIGLLLFGLPAMFRVDNSVLVTSVLVIFYLMGPLSSIMLALPDFERATISLKQVQDMDLLLSHTGDAEPAPAPASQPAGWERIELINVVHTYRREHDDSAFALGPISLSFEPGELVFLIGGNGSGKTTLAKLLASLYHPEQGEIRLDGQPITGANQERYRQLFAALFADTYVFDTLLGLEAPELDQRARDYLALFQLEQKVSIADGKLSTTALSQGQRRRLALLTAYLEDRPFYIFDEWAADQDPIFRDIFYKQLLPDLRRRNKTALVISHDDRYFQAADRIIKLEHGQMLPLEFVR